jgi:methionyl-tRNA formyltransferase
MDVVVMGNGPFAAPMLRAIAESGHSVKLVVTRPDRPQGKKLEIIPGPVASLARELQLPLEQPESVNDPAYIARLSEIKADLLVVADFGQILNKAALATTKLGGINVHASLLPKYRGAAPVAWAIYHGEATTGISIIRMTPELDGGGVLLQKELSIDPEETAGELEKRLSFLGAQLAVEAMDQLSSGRFDVIVQDRSLVTKAPRLRKEDGLIDWMQPATAISHQIRAMQPWPVAYFDWRKPNGETLRIQVTKASTVSLPSHSPPGTIVEARSGKLIVATSDGGVSIERLKPAGKKEMDAATFLNGYRVQAGDTFAPSH